MILIIGVMGYLALQIAIGYFASRNIKTDSDYFLAGRTISYPLATFSIFATWYGAEACMGTASAVYAGGLYSTRADPFGYTICLALAGFLLAKQLWSKQYTTLGDLYKERYSTGISKLAVLIMVPTSFAWTAAQIKGFGQILTLLSHIDTFWATTIATALVIVYTSMGGMLADVITDFVQGIVLMLGLIITLYFVVHYLGGVQETFAAIDTSKLSFAAPGESWFSRMDDWAIGILGSLISQELISRLLSAKSPQVAKKSALTASALYLVAGAIPVLLGLIGPKFITGLDHPDKFMPALAHKMLPTVIFVIFMGALVSAILSTVDSTLLAISAYTTHNLMGERFYKLNDKQKVLVDRVVVIVSGIVCYILAIKARTMYDLILASNAFGSAGVLVVTFLGLWLPNFGSKKAALAALIIGLIGNPIYDKIFHFQAPYLGAIASSAAAFLLIGYLEKRRAESPAGTVASFES